MKRENLVEMGDSLSLGSGSGGSLRMSMSTNSTRVDGVTSAEDREKFVLEYRGVLFLWFLFLFEPARLISFHVRALEPLKWAPTALLLGAIFLWLKSGVAKYNYKWFLIFVLVTILGTGVAFIEGNWGVARTINRMFLQYYMMGVLSFSFLSNERRITKFLNIYLWYIVYFAAWGIYSLKVQPIDPSIDPGMREIIPWHHQLNNRDGFGPLMVIGFAFCFYFYQAMEGKINKALAMFGAVLCVAGVISSFGRGVFLGMVVIIAFIWVRSKRKIVGLIMICVSAGLIYLLVSVVSPGSMYWEQIATIQEGTSAGTGAERKDLWEIALKEFADNPFFGVGTRNFGIAAVKLLTPQELWEMGYTPGKFWGRALHCAPLTILSEYGLLGSIVFILMMVDFVKTNRVNSRLALKLEMTNSDERGEESRLMARAYQPIIAGAMAAFLAFWVNGVFYEIIYDPLLWNIMIINRLCYVRLGARAG